MFNNNLPWDLPHHRYAILGIPRAGTQLFESFIKYSLSKKYDNVTDLQEIFTAHSPLTHTMYSEDGLIKIKEGSDLYFWNAKKASHDNLAMIRNGDPSQPFTCRIFLHNNNSNYNITDSIKYAQELDFKFVYISRSFEHVMLSLIFANESFIWNKVKNPNKLTIDIHQLKTMMASTYIYLTINKQLIDTMIDYVEVNYEDVVNAAHNLSEEEKVKAYGVYREKQLSVDPYDQIENSDEVKEVFNTFYPKLQELTRTLF